MQIPKASNFHIYNISKIIIVIQVHSLTLEGTSVLFSTASCFHSTLWGSRARASTNRRWANRGMLEVLTEEPMDTQTKPGSPAVVHSSMSWKRGEITIIIQNLTMCDKGENVEINYKTLYLKQVLDSKRLLPPHSRPHQVSGHVFSQVGYQAFGLYSGAISSRPSMWKSGGKALKNLIL